MNEYEDSSWSASGKYDITDRVMAICQRGTVPKLPPDKSQESASD
jgi:hypothetical protein